MRTASPLSSLLRASLATSLVLVGLTSAAHADEPAPAPAPAASSKASAVNGDTTNHFGEKGTVAVHVTTGPMIGGLTNGGTPTFGLETQKTKPENGEETSNTYFYVNPRIHYFLVHNVSIGGELLVAKAPGDTTAWGLMPKVGFDLLFGESVSFYPQAGVGFRHAGSDVVSSNWLFADIDLPLLFHPVPHLAIGLGPQFTFTLYEKTKADTAAGSIESKTSRTSYRWLTAHLIGWF